ncbi:MAG TPA: amino acid adenylation domain-containing protein, partial [Gemmatimonadales bacterium]|nr:amino acid adenylation domain-containing protein [Gemmatimonadales bacterium]
ELTAERFVTANPGGIGPRRLYRTGDRARFLASGEVEFLGRFDDQVKIRGFRVELGEIEAALLSRDGVRAAAVIRREDTPGNARLVGSVTADPGTALDPERLRAALRASLPEHLVPSVIMTLPAMPLTPNGKVDRRALPAPAAEAGRVVNQPPATPVEQRLALVFEEILERRPIGRRESFFELGGHSLLAMRAMARINREFGIRLSWAAIFESPSVADLASVVEGAMARSAGVPGLPGLAPRASGTTVPLTWSQELLWLLDRTVPELAAYNVPLLLKLSGALDTGALRRALDAIVARHEALRTTFALTEGAADPEQRVSAPHPLDLEEIDLSGTPDAGAAEAAERLIAERMRRPFDLAHDLPIRATLLHLGGEEHRLLVVTHHIVFDEWSSGVFQRELGALYSGFHTGASPDVPPLPVQYGDYALWQRAALDGGVLADQLGYWREQLRGAPTLELSTDRPRTGLPAFAGARFRFTWNSELLEGLRRLARQGDATLYMTVLAGYVALLNRYTGQNDIVVGSPVSSRSAPELEDLIGYFPNVVALRTRFAPAGSFQDLLAAVRDVCLGAFGHQDVPIEKLALELQKDGRSGNVPLIQVNYQLVASGIAPPALDGLAASGIAVDFGTAKFELALAVRETADGLEGSIEYRTDLFEAATIERLVGHLETLLRGAVREPGTAVDRLPLLPAAERHRLLVVWNATAARYPALVTLTELLERQAAHTPEAEALRYEGTSLTYAELHARANQLAHRLRGLGVTSGVRVGICAERSLELVVGLLGILKAGGAYVPLDPGYPRERLGFMLADAEVPVLLVQGQRLPSLPLGSAVRLDLEDPETRREPRTAPPPVAGPGDAAYMIYTSGSTGRPKGALNAHRGIVNRLLWMQEAFALGATDTVLQKTPFSFDVSVWEFFWPLLAGARLVLAKPEGHRDPQYLADLINRERVTVLHFVPSMLRAFLAEPAAASCRTLRDVMCSGEALPLDLMRQWYQTLPARLHNLYGPTEAAVDVTWWPCQPDYARGIVPIGRPIANTTTYILDQYGEPVPIGVPGELYLGGVQVGLGYWKRPELTAERFVADGFAATPGARLYRTGDRARYLPDANIEFLGRLDFQVKLRGFRIELGDIEATLVQHPRIKDAAVQVHQDPAGDGLLVGYVVTEDGAGPGAPAAAETVEKWAEVFDQAYGEPETAAEGSDDAEFNIRGWVSSYTLSPIPAEEMREWVDQTCDRIRELSPRRVLEIGCGTGLLLFRIAPACERYVGLDVSRGALDSIRAAPAFDRLPQVTLAEGAADQLGMFGTGEFDTVVINSVAQYFPSAEYLVSVLERALQVLRPGGSIFLGDIRSLPLLETLHASVALFQSRPGDTAAELRERVRYRLGQETELIVDPALFHAFRARCPQVTSVEVRPKLARARNELSRFRYDVVLRTAPVGTRRAGGLRMQVPSDLAEVRALLADRPQSLLVTGCTDRRLARDTRLTTLLGEAADSTTVAELQAVLGSEPESGLEPADLTTLDPRYRVDVLHRAGSPPGTFDAVFRLHEVAPVADDPPALIGGAPRPWRDYVHQPQSDTLSEAELMALRDFLGERLPDYMVPGSFVRMAALPLSPSGKLDRRALKPPALVRRSRALTPPRTERERAIAGIWAEVLHLDQVGVDESFLDLGGHSLQAMRVLGRIRAETGVTMSLIELLRGATVADLARAAEQAPGAAEEDDDLALGPAARDSFLRAEEAAP